MIGTQLSLFGPPAPALPAGDLLAGYAKRRGEAAVCVLGSGSGGNSTVVRVGDKALLIDAGFGPMTVARRLRDANLRLADIAAVCVTHLDQDHFRPTWLAPLRRAAIPLFVHRWHLDDLYDLHGEPARQLQRAGLVEVFDDEPFCPMREVRVSSFRLAHDTKGTCGFHIETPAGRIGYATDLGHVPTSLFEHFRGVDLLAIESNYDPQMQLGSSRPWFLKRRIMGMAGHLSNEQAFDAVRRIVNEGCDGSPRHIVLLHRSAQCNCPDLVRELFSQDARIAARLTLAEQRRCTPWMNL